MVISVNAAGGKPPGTSSSYSYPPLSDISRGTSPNRTLHVVNIVCPVLSEVLKQKVSLLFRGLWRSAPWVGAATGAGRLGLRPLYGATLLYEGVVAYVRGGESLARHIRNPVTELIVMCRDEAAPLAIKGVAYGKSGISAVAVFGEVWGLEDIAPEGDISPILRSQLCPIYC